MVRTSPPARCSSVPIHSTWPRGSRFHDSRSSRPWSRSHLHRSSRRSRSARSPWESHRTCSLPEAAARKTRCRRQDRDAQAISLRIHFHRKPPAAQHGWIDKNGCTGEPQPSDLLDSVGADCGTVESALPTGAYQGCMEGYPVIWCPRPGRPHEIPSWSGLAIATFFQQF